MSDAIDRAAEVIHEVTEAQDYENAGVDSRAVAQSLSEAGLLAPAPFVEDIALRGVERVPAHGTSRGRGDAPMTIHVENESWEVSVDEYKEWLVENGARLQRRWVTEWHDVGRTEEERR